MASAEELARLIESTVRAVLSGLQGSQNPIAGSSGNKKILDPKASHESTLSQERKVNGGNGHSS